MAEVSQVKWTPGRTDQFGNKVAKVPWPPEMTCCKSTHFCGGQKDKILSVRFFFFQKMSKKQYYIGSP